MSSWRPVTRPDCPMMIWTTTARLSSPAFGLLIIDSPLGLLDLVHQPRSDHMGVERPLVDSHEAIKLSERSIGKMTMRKPSDEHARVSPHHQLRCELVQLPKLALCGEPNNDVSLHDPPQEFPEGHFVHSYQFAVGLF